MNKLLLAAKAALVGLLVGFLAISPAFGQVVSYTDISQGARVTIPVSPTKPLPVSGTFSPSAFAPTGQASLSVTTTSARVALASSDPTAVVQNTGSTTAYVLFGNASVVATTTTGYPVTPGATVAFAVGSAVDVAAITASSTTTLSITTGTGVPAVAGASSSGGGGGGAVTVADGADVTQGAVGDSACATDNGVTCTINALLKRNNQRETSIISVLGSPFQAGGSIGNTTFASTVADAANVALGAKADGVCGTSTGTCTLLALIKYLNTQAAIIAAAAADLATHQPVDAFLTAATTGGCTPYGLASAASTNSSNIKASAGTLCSVSAVNTTATLYYLRFYNAASAPTCSSATNFVLTVPVPASATGAGVVVNTGSFGWAFTTGISFCLTGGGSSTDNTNAATGVYLAASYK